MATANLSAETQAYLAEKKVMPLMEHLFHELAVNTPADPLAFLEALLQAPPKGRIVILAPPGCAVANRVAVQLEQQLGAQRISTDSIGAAVAAVKGANAGHQSWILERVPRTKADALTLQSAGGLPSIALVVDADDSDLDPSDEGEQRALKEFRMHEADLRACFNCNVVRVSSRDLDSKIVAAVNAALQRL